MAENVEVKIHILENIQSTMDAINRKLGETNTKVKEVNTSFMNLSNVMNVARSVWGAVSGVVSQVVELGAQAEQTSVAFTQLIGNEELAGRMLGEIDAYAAKTPFSQLQLVDAAKTMLNFGVAADEVNMHLKELGDISMGDANKLNSLALVFGQVASAGKMQGQDLMQFINQGFNPLKELEKMTGMAYKDLQAAMAKGAVSADMVAAALAHATGEGGQFEGMADKLSQTFSGKLSTVIGKFQQLAIGLFKKIKPALLALLDAAEALETPLRDIGNGIVAIISALIEWAPAIGAVTVAIAAYNVAVNASAVITKVVTFATTAWAKAQAALNVIMSLNPIGLVVAAVAALVAVIVICWNKFDKFRAVVKTTWDTVKGFGSILKDYVVERIKSVISGLGAMGGAIAKLFKGDFSGALDTAKQGIKQLSGYEAKVAASRRAAELVNGVGDNYRRRLVNEQIRQLAQKTTATNEKRGRSELTQNELAALANASGAGAKSTKAGDKTKSAAEATVTGGTRNTSITINFDKEMVAMNFNGGYMDNLAQVESTLEEQLLRVLNAAKAAI